MADPIVIQQLNPQPNEDTYFETLFTLDGTSYGFRFYNTGQAITPSAWFMDIFNVADESTVVGGIGMAVGVSLLEPYRYKGRSLIPPGQLFVADLRTLVFDTETQTFSNQPGFDPETNSYSENTHVLYYAPEALTSG